MRPLVITLLSAVILGGFVFAGAAVNLYALPSFTLVILLYMAFMTSSVILIIQKQNDRILFSQAYLASIVFKILTSLGLVLVLIRLNPAGAAGNAALFIISYMVFTAVEVVCLLQSIRSQNK